MQRVGGGLGRGGAVGGQRSVQVQLAGFGTFETKQRDARQGINPKTRETIEIPAATVPVFKAGKGLKDKVAK